MKKIKKKLALNFIGVMVIIVGSGFMQIGHAAATTAEPETALSNFTVAFNNYYKTVTSPYLPFVGTGRLDQDQLAYDRGVLDEAYKAIEEGLKAAQEQLTKSENVEALEENLDNLEGWLSIKAEADRLLGRRSTTPSQALPPSIPASSDPVPQGDPEPEVDPIDEDEDSDETTKTTGTEDGPVILPAPLEGTPNPEGETPINGVETVTLFGKTLKFQHPRLVFINPNPEVSTTSSTINPFTGARPTIDLRAPVINDGVSAINLKGLAIPNINLREAVINPDPEGTPAPSTGTSPFQTAPKISNPILPKSAVTPYLNNTLLQKSLSTEQQSLLQQRLLQK